MGSSGGRAGGKRHGRFRTGGGGFARAPPRRTAKRRVTPPEFTSCMDQHRPPACHFRACAWCAADVAIVRRPGRPRLYCNHACRQRAYEHRHGFTHERAPRLLPGQAPPDHVDDWRRPFGAGDATGYERGGLGMRGNKAHALRPNVRPEGRRRETLCGLLAPPVGRPFSLMRPRRVPDLLIISPTATHYGQPIEPSNELARLRAIIDEATERRLKPKAALAWLRAATIRAQRPPQPDPPSAPSRPPKRWPPPDRGASPRRSPSRRSAGPEPGDRQLPHRPAVVRRPCGVRIDPVEVGRRGQSCRSDRDSRRTGSRPGTRRRGGTSPSASPTPAGSTARCRDRWRRMPARPTLDRRGAAGSTRSASRRTPPSPCAAETAAAASICTADTLELATCSTLPARTSRRASPAPRRRDRQRPGSAGSTGRSGRCPSRRRLPSTAASDPRREHPRRVRLLGRPRQELGRDDHLVTPAGERRADVLLGSPVAVHLGGVDVGDPGVDRGVHDRGGLRRVEPPAEVVPAEADHRQLGTGGTEPAGAISRARTRSPRPAPGPRASPSG